MIGVNGTPGGCAAAAFSHVSTWIFDLDDTLYPSATGLDAEMRRRVRLFLAQRLHLGPEAAEALHRDYVDRFGATLQAVVELHGVRPADFLRFVHDVDLSRLRPDAKLATALAALPGRRLVFTNGSQRHAQDVLRALDLAHLFEDICHIERHRFVGKPQQAAYDAFVAAFGVEPATAAMFDDRAANLAIPRRLGMRTILVVPPDAPPPDGPPEAADFVTDDLPAFLSGLTEPPDGA